MKILKLIRFSFSIFLSVGEIISKRALNKEERCRRETCSPNSGFSEPVLGPVQYSTC